MTGLLPGLVWTALSWTSFIMYTIHPEELEIKETTSAPKWAKCLDRLEFDENGSLHTLISP